MERGFSLTEVLLSLVLMITLGLGLLNQQWRNIQTLNELNAQNYRLTYDDNAQEQYHPTHLS